jgi:ABC-type nitrate/sulfonate/bicarbonate transport system substrate-binding protein
MVMTRRSALLGLTAVLGSVRPNLAAESATIAYGGLGYIWSLMFVAEARRVWEKFGVSAVPVDFATGREAMQAVLGGSAEFGTATETPFVFAALQGLEPLILASFSRHSRDMAIMMGPKSGADPNDPSSLKGKTIATRVGTSGQYLLSRYLRMASLKDNDVKIVDLSPNDMVATVMRGSVDGFSWDVGLSTLLAAASNNTSFVMTQKGIDDFFVLNQLLLTNRRSLEAKPDLMLNAARVLLEAEDLMTKDRDWPKAIASRVRSDADAVAKFTSVFEFKVRLDQKVLGDIVNQAEWAIEKGLAKDPGKDVRSVIRALIVEKPLQTIAPSRVDL